LNENITITNAFEEIGQAQEHIATSIRTFEDHFMTFAPELMGIWQN